MDKVAINSSAPINFVSSSIPNHVRGHHSSINKAVGAHRQMVEERTNRQSFRKLDNSAPAYVFSEDTPITQTTTDASGNISLDNTSDYSEHEVIDPSSNPAKLAVVQAFQSLEPSRPILGEPIPKGSYLDVEA